MNLFVALVRGKGAFTVRDANLYVASEKLGNTEEKNKKNCIEICHM